MRDDGGLLVCADQQRVEFALDGTVVGRTRVDVLPPQWIFQPGRRDQWEVSSRRVELVDADGKAVRALDRGSNGRWFDDLQAGCAAPDGSLAVLDEPNLHILDPSGTPRASLRLPDAFSDARIAFDGRRIAVLSERELFLLRADGDPIGRFPIPEVLGKAWFVFFSPGGDELWVFPHDRAEMFRFAAPR